MNAWKGWSQAAAILTLAYLAGCGGGGGGGGADTAGTNLVKGVIIGTPTASTDIIPVVVGDPLTLVLNGTITGDYTKLQGKAVYVTVEDPAAVFLPAAEVALYSAVNSLDYTLTLHGKAATAPQRLTGKLRIFVCLDQACRQPLAGTPMTVPYDLTVQNNLTISRSLIEVEVPFGTVPPPEKVSVTWPESSTGYAASSSYATDPNRPPFLVEIQSQTSPTTGFSKQPEFSIVFGPSHPGSYTTTVQLRSELRAPYQYLRNLFTKNLTVRYTIVANPALDHFFLPARSDFTAERKIADRVLPSFTLTTTTNVTQSYMGVEYLTSAGTAGPYRDWFSATPRPLVRPCGTATAPAQCLDAGVYTAQLRYRLKTPTGERDVLYPIAMTVLP